MLLDKEKLAGRARLHDLHEEVFTTLAAFGLALDPQGENANYMTEPTMAYIAGQVKAIVVTLDSVKDCLNILE